MHRSSDLGGVAAMLAATGTFVVCDTFMKLVAEELPPFEVLFLRGVAASLGCLVLVVLGGYGRALSGALNGRALLRAAAEMVSVLCYIVALASLPIADVIAILQTAPLIVVLGAAVLLREKIGLVRLALVVSGFVGAILVAQPGPAGVSAAALLGFAAAVLVAVRDLVGRGVPSGIPVMVTTFATNVMVMLGAGVMSLATETWEPPTGGHIGFLAMAGLFVTLGHVGVLAAYRMGRTAAVAPFFYAFALWGVIAGFLVWGTLPNALAFGGIVLIVGSGILIIALDQRRGRSKRVVVADAAS